MSHKTTQSHHLVSPKKSYLDQFWKQNRCFLQLNLLLGSKIDPSRCNTAKKILFKTETWHKNHSSCKTNKRGNLRNIKYGKTESHQSWQLFIEQVILLRSIQIRHVNHTIPLLNHFFSFIIIKIYLPAIFWPPYV